MKKKKKSGEQAAAIAKMGVNLDFIFLEWQNKKKRGKDLFVPVSGAKLARENGPR